MSYIHTDWPYLLGRNIADRNWANDNEQKSSNVLCEIHVRFGKIVTPWEVIVQVLIALRMAIRKILIYAPRNKKRIQKTLMNDTRSGNMYHGFWRCSCGYEGEDWANEAGDCPRCHGYGVSEENG